MEAIDFWRVPDHYSIVQAALLACGLDPEDLQYSVENNADRPPGYVPIRTALYNAVKSGKLPTQVVEYERDGFDQEPSLDLHRTLIAVADLDAFLRQRGIVCETFGRSWSETFSQPAPGHAQFPLKLDAAIKAWTAVTSNPATLRGKSPKQALAKWLTENANELGLLNKSGQPNRSGIEEICKVANWKPRGGATPTPSAQPETAKSPIVERGGPQRSDPNDYIPGLSPRGPREKFTDDLPDEIPF